MSDDLGLPFQATAEWFSSEKKPSYVFVSVTPAHAAALPTALGMAIRRCYISDDRVSTQAAKYPPATRVIAAALPDPGAVMSGEFGEILTYFYQGSTVLPTTAIGLRRLRPQSVDLYMSGHQLVRNIAFIAYSHHSVGTRP